MTVPHKWLLLLYGLPTRQSAERVSLWRKLKKFGALPLKTSAYVLPDQPAHFERFQWLAKQVRDDGGESTLIRVSEIEGVANEEIARMFNDARAQDYGELMKSLTRFIDRNRKRRLASFETDLDKFNRRFIEISEIDYFDCPIAHDAQMLLKHAAGSLKSGAAAGPGLDRKKFLGKTWLTRPRPEIDRVGSAWLIRKFIDPKARFIFAAEPSAHPQAIPTAILPFLADFLVVAFFLGNPKQIFPVVQLPMENVEKVQPLSWNRHYRWDI